MLPVHADTRQLDKWLYSVHRNTRKFCRICTSPRLKYPCMPAHMPLPPYVFNDICTCTTTPLAAVPAAAADITADLKAPVCPLSQRPLASNTPIKFRWKANCGARSGALPCPFAALCRAISPLRAAGSRCCPARTRPSWRAACARCGARARQRLRATLI